MLMEDQSSTFFLMMVALITSLVLKKFWRSINESLESYYGTLIWLTRVPQFAIIKNANDIHYPSIFSLRWCRTVDSYRGCVADLCLGS